MLVDSLGWAVLALVGILLVAGFRQQFVRLSPRGMVIERFGLTPQWKFFGQRVIDECDWEFEDMHLLVRLSGHGDQSCVEGEWQQIAVALSRNARTAFWHPETHVVAALVNAMQMLARAEQRQPRHLVPDCVPYLTVLRAVLDATPLRKGEAIQFAVASCTGHRRARAVTLRFLSAWHRP